MNYPLISEYIESIKSAEDNFEELSYLNPVLGDDGLPVMTSGNFAVVFKMKDEQSGKFYAVKCFTKEQEGRAEAYREIAKELKNVSSPYILSIRYLDKELFVDTDQTTETEFPVLLMDWVEGKTLDKYLRENLDDKYALEMLAYRFSQLAQWLIPQPFAHGDLKPDNILVREDGALVLVDYDGMYVPAMKGQKAREIGSPDFRHPQRTENDFDEHSDDFTLIVILLSLKAISLKSNLYEKYGLKEGLLLSGKDYINISKCKLLKELFPSEDIVLNNLISSFIIVLSENSIQKTIYELLNSRLLEWQHVQIVSTSYSEKDINGSWKDEYNVHYSKDNTKLLYGPQEVYIPYEIRNYSIRKGTIVICNCAFDWGHGALKFGNITIPETVTHIGDFAFGSQLFKTITIPNSVVHIGLNPFIGCDSIEKIECLSSRFVVHDNVLYSYDMKRLIYYGFKDNVFSVPDRVKIIDDSAFAYCKSIEQVGIPSSVISIGDRAFWGCDHLKIVFIYQSVVEIGYGAFDNCESLERIIIPVGTTERFEQMLPGLEDKLIEDIQTEKPNLDTKVTAEELASAWIDEFGVKYSKDKKKLLEGPTEENIKGSHIWKKMVLFGSYTIKQGTIIICDKAFLNCMELESIILPNSIKIIGSHAFKGCRKLSSVKLNYGLTSIGDWAFSNCMELHSILIPNSVEYIGTNAFEGNPNIEIYAGYGDKIKLETILPNFIIKELPF